MKVDQLASRALSPLGSLPSGWQMVKLKDIAKKVGSGATPKGGQSAYLPTRQHFALIRSQNVFDRRFSSEGLVYISDDQAADLRGAEVQPEDLLLNITGDGITFARACLAPKSVLPACVNQHVSILRTDPSRCCPGFLLSYLTHPAVKGYIESFNAGGSRRAITKGHIESFEVPLPPMPEQQHIAYILGTLDDKIDLNRRMNETLESMAQALFQSWFVDFDPVRAKAEGRKPAGMDATTAGLFPDGFEESPLGSIPKRWKVGTVGGIATISRDSLIPQDFAEEVFDHYSIPAFDEGRLPKSERGADIRSNKFIVPPGAVLVSKLNPRIPRVWLPWPSCRRPVCSTEFLVVLPTVGSVEREYLFAFFRSPQFGEDFASRVTGTSGSHQRVKSDDLLAIGCPIPTKPTSRHYAETVGPMLERVARNLEESRTLAALRDALLPKLLSGEIRVKDAEKMAES